MKILCRKRSLKCHLMFNISNKFCKDSFSLRKYIIEENKQKYSLFIYLFKIRNICHCKMETIWKCQLGQIIQWPNYPFKRLKATRQRNTVNQSKPCIERIIVVLEVGCLGEIGGGYQTLSKNDLWWTMLGELSERWAPGKKKKGRGPFTTWSTFGPLGFSWTCFFVSYDKH